MNRITSRLFKYIDKFMLFRSFIKNYGIVWSDVSKNPIFHLIFDKKILFFFILLKHDTQNINQIQSF